MFSSSVPGSSSSAAPANGAPDRKVNHLLHTLRGEHFRRGLNADRVRLARAAALASGGPTLPPLDALDRALALELCFAPPPRDSLVQMCLEIILAQETDVVLEILPELPVHLRKQIMLHTAVHAPLSPDGVRALLARHPAGGVGGELVLARSYGAQFLQRAGVLGSADTATAAPTPSREWDWDDDDEDDRTPLHTLILLSAPLAPPLLSLLPATLTRLALLALPAPLAGLHRLPALLPLLTFVDLSFNPWMLDRVAHEGDERAIDRVQWSRWRRLQVLGLRQCGFDASSARKLEEAVQKGRLHDVVVYT